MLYNKGVAHQRVPTVKGQSIAAYDPRGIQGMAVTYTSSPMGADHTAGLVIEESIPELGGTLDPLSPVGQVELSRNKQIHMAMIDAAGICDFAQTGLTAPEGLKNLTEMIAAKTGTEFDEEDWKTAGNELIQLERDFNFKAGLKQADDRLPDFFYEEPLLPHNKVVEVKKAEIAAVFTAKRS